MKTHRASALAIVTTSLLSIATAPARADFSYNFNNGNDVGLTHYDPLAPFGSGATYTFPVLGAGNDGYRLTSGPSADPGSLGLPRVGAYVAGQAFIDFRESVDIVSWNQSLEQGIGLGARLSSIGLGTSNGYFLHYNTAPTDQHGELRIDRIDGESPNPAASFVLLNHLDPAAGFRLVFTGAGATLTGQIFSLGGQGNALATVTLTDGTYRSGSLGVLTTGILDHANTALEVTYDNFSGQAVPEPSSAVLLTIGAVGLLVAGRRRGGRTPGAEVRP